MRDLLLDHLNVVVERHPGVGIFAAASGFVSSLLSFLQMISLGVGIVAALFGALAGYYTMRIKRQEWSEKSHHHENTTDSP